MKILDKHFSGLDPNKKPAGLVDHYQADNILARAIGPKATILQIATNIRRVIQTELLKKPSPKDLYPFTKR